MEFSKHKLGYDLRDNLPRNAHFWQVGLLDIVLSEYIDRLGFHRLPWAHFPEQRLVIEPNILTNPIISEILFL